MVKTDAVLERLEKLHPKVIDLSLGRILNLLDKLGQPQNRLPPVIHVAGTNGKGSTIAFMRSILEQAGLKVHVYTSPHLVRFNERIRIAGKLIEEDILLQTLEEVENVNQNQPITFFEIITATAMLVFSRTPADILLLETGLGGKYDATNIIKKPLVSVITPISIDHENFLGNTLDKIAGEKIPIIKPDSKAVIAKQEKIVHQLVKKHITNMNTELFRCGYEWQYQLSGQRFIYQSIYRNSQFPLPQLVGNHQIHNAATAIAALEALASYDKKFRITDEIISKGLLKVSWYARLQELNKGKLVELVPNSRLWLDGGHNPSAGEILNEFWKEKSVYVIIAMLNTKDSKGILRYITKFAKKIIFTKIPDNKNSCLPEDLLMTAKELGFYNSVVCNDFKDGIKLCAKENPENILICGSLYLAGKVLEVNDTPPN